MNLDNEIGKVLFENTQKLKSLGAKKVDLLESHIVNQIINIDRSIKKDSVLALVQDNFSCKIEEIISYLFSYYSDLEIQLYKEYSKTMSLIFDTIKENKTKVIYLENIIKKIENREIDTNQISEKVLKDKDRDKNKEKDEDDKEKIFELLILNIAEMYHLSSKEVKELRIAIMRTQDLFKQDINNNIEKYIRDNKNKIIYKIIEKMDEEQIREGKTRQQFLLERNLTENAKKACSRLLEETIKKYKGIAIEDLAICSTNMVNLIFKLLPDEYKNQRQLLEIIIDTDINERIGNVIETVAKNLSNSLEDKNSDIIQNELYEEKRYRNHKEYHFDYDEINQVYKDVVHEIRIAYDIPEEGLQARRLDFAVSAEDNSTKDVIKKFIDVVTQENELNLTSITTDLRNINVEGKDENIVSQKRENSK